MPQCVLLRVELKGIAPPIWRSLTVPTSVTIHQLHEAVQAVMGWKSTHLYRFKLGDDICQLPDEDGPAHATNSLKEVLDEWLLDGMTQLEYLYDFGDGWAHELAFGKLWQNTNPACLDGARACPPEDCGGVPGYLDLIQAMASNNPEHREPRRWAKNWQPETFDLEQANQRLLKKTTLGARLFYFPER